MRSRIWLWVCSAIITVACAGIAIGTNIIQPASHPVYQSPRFNSQVDPIQQPLLPQKGNLAATFEGSILSGSRIHFTEVGSLWLAGIQVADVDAVGNYAFAACRSAGLVVFDISDPSQPTVVGRRWDIGDASQITVSGSYAYVAAGRLVVIDISNPTQPNVLASVPSVLPEDVYAFDVTVRDNYAYVANYTGGLEIVDISNPHSPIVVGACSEVGAAHCVTVQGNFAYIGCINFVGGDPFDRIAGLSVVDISNPSAPLRVGHDTTFAFGRDPVDIYDVAVSGDYAYLTSPAAGLFIFDISNPSTPSKVTLTDTLRRAIGIEIDGSTAYVTQVASGGLSIYDLTNPIAPVQVGFTETNSTCYHVSVYSGKAYLAGYGYGLLTADVSVPTAPSMVGRWYKSGEPASIAVSGTLVCVGNRDGGLAVVDVTNPTAPSLASTYQTPDWALEAATYGNYVYLAANDRILGFDISDPAHPRTVFGRIAYYPQAVAITDHYLFVACTYDGVLIFDISNPESPSLKATLKTLGQPEDIAISGNNAVIGENGVGAIFIDISNPELPAVVGRYQPESDEYAHEVAIQGNLAFFSEYGGVTVLDITNPATPTKVGRCLGYAGYLAVSGDLLFDGDYAGTQVFDISNPASPTEVCKLGVGSSGFNVAGNRVIIAAPNMGLRIMDFTDYYCGDADGSGTAADIADLSFFVDFLFAGGPAPVDLAAANIDGVGSVDVGDLTSLVDFLFSGQPTLQCQ